MNTVDQHNQEIGQNLVYWQKKPVLQKIYHAFHQHIARCLPANHSGLVVELGSGVPDIRQVIPDCIRTDVFPNPWIDQTENAYNLTFASQSVSALILFDVFHHLRYPGTALLEFDRVLQAGGRVIIFEPCISWLGRLVYGVFHHEPLALNQRIDAYAPANWSPANIDYYAAQGNASRLFLQQEMPILPNGWHQVAVQRFSAITYVLSGGYSKPQLFPDAALGLLQRLERWCDVFPCLLATRLLVVLEKTGSAEAGKPA